MAWKLTEQEMKERKLDLETFRSRRVVRHAINTEAVLNLPEEQCNDQFTWEAQTGFPASARARMRAHVEELLAAALNPAPAGHVSTAPFQEETAKLGDGSLRCCRYITKFDADAQEVVAEFVAIRVGELNKLQQEEQEAHAAGEAERRLEELNTMGICKWERVTFSFAKTTSLRATSAGPPRARLGAQPIAATHSTLRLYWA
jgi:hypothetical protein